ncbi:MAG: hypothetical protein ACLQUY_05775 [Ktedonobacterales bacterium]
MNRSLWPIMLGLLVCICMGITAGCSGATTSGVRTSPTSGTLAAIPSPTSVALSVELGTGLAGSIPNVSVTNPTDSFTATDSFAFVIHLRVPINATKLACLIFDPELNVAYEWYETAQPSDTVLASYTPALGSILEKNTSGGPPGSPSITPPLGTYVLDVEIYPSSPINYADNVAFTYNG